MVPLLKAHLDKKILRGHFYKSNPLTMFLEVIHFSLSVD